MKITKKRKCRDNLLIKITESIGPRREDLIALAKSLDLFDLEEDLRVVVGQIVLLGKKDV